MVDGMVDVLGHVGVSKSGKTFAMQREAGRAIASGRRVVVFDRLNEWPGVCAAPSAAQCDVAAVGRALSSAHRLVIVRPRRGEATRPTVERVVSQALDARGWIVCLNEAHHYLPVDKPLAWTDKAGRHDALDELVTAYRHYQSALWWDSQRLAKVNPTVREQTEKYRFFAQGWDMDFKRLGDIGGRELRAAAEQVSGEFQAGRAGFHVPMLRGQRPPYRVER